MAQDIIDLLEDYVPANDRKKWAKLSSDIEFRRLELLLLKEILLELRRVNEHGRGMERAPADVK